MTVLLLDGTNLLYRSFVTLPRSIKARGESIQGVYGLLGTIPRLIRETGATKGIAGFDVLDVPTFRHKLYPQYQGQRGPLGGDQAEDFRRQFQIAMEVLPTLGIPALSKARYEADDVIGTLCHELREAGEPLIMISTDRDLWQLVNGNAEVLIPTNPAVRLQTAEEVRERTGVMPGLLPTFKSLAGDASDNIPGVAGIGPKTARELVHLYGTLEEIYSSLDQLPSKTASSLNSSRELAFIFRDVATIRTDLRLPKRALKLGSIDATSETRPRQLLERAGYGEQG